MSTLRPTRMTHVPSPRSDPWSDGERALLDAIPDATALLDHQGVIRQVNLAWEMFALDNGGTEKTTGIGVDYLAVCDRAAASGCRDAEVAATGLRAVLAGQSREREFEYACPSPAYGRWFVLRTTPLGGRLAGALVSHVNTTRRKTAEQELERRASQDPLTGLANRSLLSERLGQALSDATSASGQVGVLFLDLNGFKPVNDTFGHAAGDEVLLEVARRLRDNVQPHHTVARAGGDEFAVVAPGVTAATLDTLTRTLRAALAKPHQVYGRAVTVGASIGAHLACVGDDKAAALHAADERMYADKRMAAQGSATVA